MFIIKQAKVEKLIREGGVKKNMRILGILALVLILSIGIQQPVFASSENDTQTQLKALHEQIKVMQAEHQKQIEMLKAQLDELKKQVAEQPKEKPIKVASNPIARPDTVVDRTFENAPEGTFRLRDAVGLTEESRLNIGGEMKMRYRENIHEKTSSKGFQFYELELFLDSALNDYSSVYTEYNLMHENTPDPEDVWIDFHTKPGEIAATGNTGVKIGNFHYPFGWDNDDNEGFIYGGRTTVNVPTIRDQRVDGWRIRERQIGVAGNYSFDLGKIPFTATAGIFNGSGSWRNSPGYDNDEQKDFAGRLEAKFSDVILGVSGLFAPRTRGVTANANNTQHLRDIQRYGVHFKYPDVPFPGQDMSLGGKKWMLWGEYLYGINNANTTSITLDSANDTQKLHGGYAEIDYAIKPEKLLGFLRFDYYEPDRDVSKDVIWALTPGVKLNFLGSSYFIAEYEHYDGGTNASTSVVDSDRVTLEVSTMF